MMPVEPSLISPFLYHNNNPFDDGNENYVLIFCFVDYDNI